ncbi:Usp family protein [Rhodococcus ruber BKS 20-38]|uniref:Usp family protein n=1 Tax=Rhodococcus ruber BKS 20-38 TaxID=1278076 RepID=M2YX18_9NOCA|nr:universal stress protein [Rhodococcus ruber]EME53268.1 Usp family protein [Rhodococcus ruber BKS 20-38]
MSDSPVITVDVDGTLGADGAAVWAAAIAHRHGWGLRLVHTLPEALYLMSDIEVMRQGPAVARTRSGGESILDHAAELVRARFSGLEIGTELLLGPPEAALAAAGSRARMIVLAHERGGLVDRLLGSPVLEVVKRASCPVTFWCGTPGQLPDRRPVVLGVDGSALGDTALVEAFEFASLFGAPLTAVHTWSVQSDAGGVTNPLLLDTDVLADDAKSRLTAYLATLRELFADVPVIEVVTQDEPARALLRAADGAQLLVVGTHGRGRIAGAFYGSVSRHLLRHSPCPTMLCRPSSHSQTLRARH